jgi:acetyl esterase/lipase
VKCADGKLYTTAVLREGPHMPATGRYSSGATIPLLLDMYTPPPGAPSSRPTIIEIHGGAFVGGSRSDMAGVSKQ